MIFKRFKVAEKNASDACRGNRELEKRLCELKEEIEREHERIESVISYLLPAACPMCGSHMTYATERRWGVFEGTFKPGVMHVLRCPKDKFEVVETSLKECIDKIKKTKKEEGD